MSPLSAALSTLVSACAILGCSSLLSRVVFACVVLLWLVRRQSSFRPLFRALRWFCVAGVPLFLMHTIANTGFAISARVLGGIPIRMEGLLFGASVLANFMIITFVAMAWSTVNRGNLFDALVSLRLPIWVTIAGTQSVATLYLVRRRADAVFLAQRARGIPVGPALLARIRAVPTVVLPVITMTLVDASGRAAALASRGLGASRVAPLKRLSCSSDDVTNAIWLVAAAGLAALAIQG